MTADARQLRLLVASELPGKVNEELAAHFAVSLSSPAEFASVLRRGQTAFDALLISVDVPLGAGALAELPRSIRAIATYSVGVDHIDLAAARQRELAVFNTPDVLGDAVAEVAMFLMLGAARRATESIALLRSRRWAGWTATQLNGVELAGRRLGIFGMGKIGQKIASRARAFDMRISYTNRHPVEGNLAAGAAYHSDLSQMIREIDVLLLAAPSTPLTRGIVNETLLAHARPGLIVVNIARGDLVVDRDLLDALSDGRVMAAGLDVFAGEPNIDSRYFDLPNVFMLPHIGSSTLEARRRMGAILIAALQDWREGRVPSNQVI